MHASQDNIPPATDSKSLVAQTFCLAACACFASRLHQVDIPAAATSDDRSPLSRSCRAVTAEDALADAPAESSGASRLSRSARLPTEAGASAMSPFATTCSYISTSQRGCKKRKRKEKTTPFGINFMRSQVLYPAATVHGCNA